MEKKQYIQPSMRLVVVTANSFLMQSAISIHRFSADAVQLVRGRYDEDCDYEE